MRLYKRWYISRIVYGCDTPGSDTVLYGAGISKRNIQAYGGKPLREKKGSADKICDKPCYGFFCICHSLCPDADTGNAVIRDTGRVFFVSCQQSPSAFNVGEYHKHRLVYVYMLHFKACVRIYHNNAYTFSCPKDKKPCVYKYSGAGMPCASVYCRACKTDAYWRVLSVFMACR